MYLEVLPILHGERKTGVTLHRIRNSIDMGEIIEQRKILIVPMITFLNLYRKFIAAGTELLTDYTNLKLILKLTAYQIKNQIRAFAFRAYWLPQFRGGGIMDCAIADDAPKEKLGTLISENEVSFRLSTIDYDVILFKDAFNEIFEAIRLFEK